MARIIDKDTRLIDVDFGTVGVNIVRSANAQTPDAGAGSGSATFAGVGENQLLWIADGAGGTDVIAGSFIQFQRLDLDYMTMNNEMMQPVEVSVQRTSSVPIGTHENGNNYSTMQEYIFILSRPLNNEELQGTATGRTEIFETLGLNRGSTGLGGANAGGVSHEQNIYAEKRVYSWNIANAATVENGAIITGQPSKSYYTAPHLQDVNTWGSLSTITGPNLYCYRVVVMQLQSFYADGTILKNVLEGGFSTITFPPVNVAFLCKDPKFSEGQYLTRLANAMNSIPEGGPTA